MDIEPPDTLFGLYHGTPLPERPWAYGTCCHDDRISIYQRPILDACQTEDEVVATIGETVIHEVGHYFGLSEEELEAIRRAILAAPDPSARGRPGEGAPKVLPAFRGAAVEGEES